MGNTPSSPLIVVTPTNDESPSNESSRARNRRLWRFGNQSSTSSSLGEPPPPYSPTAFETAPPVPPREARRVSSSSTIRPQVQEPPGPSHRRTVSSATSTSSRTTNTSGGTGGFLSLTDSRQGPGSPHNHRTLAAARSMETLRINTAVQSSATATPSRQPRNARSPQPSPVPVRAPGRRNSREDPLEYLRKFDTVIIVDDSSSMEGSLWFEAREALAGIAEAAARYDANGIDLHFLNDRTVGTNLKKASDVKRIFDRVRPRGITPTGEKLEELLLEYLLRLETGEKPKPVNFVVLTDGAPTDDPETVIITAAKRLDAQHAPIAQVGIQFVQLGSDPEATEALRQLDDELAKKYDTRDMVDTTLYSGCRLTAELLSKILLGGVNRKVDKHGIQSPM